MSSPARDAVARMLARADVALDGDRPWDMRVHDERFFERVLAGGSLALGESYMDGWWDVERLDEFVYRTRRVRLDRDLRYDWRTLWLAARSRLINRQNPRRAPEVAERHYDLDHELFEAMLDPRMVYTCGYWKDAGTLAEAQVAKMDLVCRKLGLQPGDRVLDIGCGFGSFARYAAETYGARVTGISLSKGQTAWAHEHLPSGLPVEIRVQDYREVDERFDHVASIGMFEAVGWRNFRAYMEVIDRVLAEDGLFVLQTFGTGVSVKRSDPWFDKYIFPNGMIPSIEQIGRAVGDLLVMEDWHNFGADYDRTLMAWHANVEAAWDRLPARYDERFRRMWRYYLLSLAGAFRARTVQLWQIVFSRRGVPGGHATVR
ncbi:MAG TPA: cyclopropane fatty acyl phospholipid synthase [Gemmatimonadota bacterium]|nr:cyclopropane fatty acyl phospholipid synthase [Gemmatimonadota bacterium]